MVYGVQLTVAYSSANRRDAARSAAVTRAAPKPRWGADEVVVAALDEGTNGLAIEWRFANRADADDLFDFVAARTPAPVAGSRLVEHECTHDEGRNACRILRTRAW